MPRSIAEMKQTKEIGYIKAFAQLWQAKLAMHLTEAWMNFLRNRARALLSMSGVVMGSAAIVATMTIGISSQLQSRSQFLAMRPDVWVLRAPEPVNGKTLQFKRSDVQAMPHNLQNVRSVAPISMVFRSFKPARSKPLTSSATSMNNEADLGASISTIGTTESASFVALDEHLTELLGLHIAQGRSLTEHDRFEHHLVLGAQLAQSLAGHGDNPVQPGDTVRFDDTVYRVVGVLKAGDFPAGLPLNINSSAFYREATTGNTSRSVDLALIRIDMSMPAEQVQKELFNYWKPLLNGRRPVMDPPSQLLAAMDGQASLLSTLLGSMAALSMLLGAAGILNTLLVAVNQRRQEIGIRLAIGAQPVDICALFLAEAAVLSVMGGVLGAALGYFASVSFAWATGMPVVMSTRALLIGTTVCLVTGLLAGIYPAWRASRLHPVQAMQT